MNKVPTEVINHDVSDLPGLLLHVVLAEHIALNHQTTRAKSRQVGYHRKGLSMSITVFHASCSWVGLGSLGRGGTLTQATNAVFALFYYNANWSAYRVFWP